MSVQLTLCKLGALVAELILSADFDYNLEDEHRYFYRRKVVIIKSERCVIRPFQEEDIGDFMLYRNNMDWMRYQGFKGLNKQEYMAGIVGEFSLQEGLQLAIISNQTNKLIGDVYLKEEDGGFWLGYTISPSMARQGYAYEAACALINELRAKKAKCVKASVEAENIASIGLLKKLKFKPAGTDGNEQIYILNLRN